MQNAGMIGDTQGLVSSVSTDGIIGYAELVITLLQLGTGH